MAHEAHLIIENKERQLLTFKMDYFKVQNSILDKWAYTTINDTLDSLSEAAELSLSSFYSKDAIAFGGFFNLTMETTSDDSWLYEWFLPDESSSTMVKHGRIDFYGDDEFYPFKRIEFWDAWIPNISEAMCSTGTNPMIMSLQLMPATIRYNNEEVHRKVWYITDIDKKAKNVVSEERELFVTDIKWRGRKKDYISSVYRKDMMLNHNLTLEVEVKNHLQGDSFELQVKQSNGRRIKGQGTEFTVTGQVNDEGNIVLIENFKVECDFAEDNQNFGNIEFYHKGRKVAEFKENFGWTYIVEGGVTKVFVNIELDISQMPSDISELEIKDAIQGCFRRTLENSSDGKVTGKLFFSGTYTIDAPQYVPFLKIVKGRSGNGNIYNGMVTAEIEILDGNPLGEVAIVTIHELLHSVRIDHPFEKTQAEDTRLFNDGFRRYTTALSTDPQIYYNIMLYNICIINGYLLDDLWKRKDPEYLTRGQLELMLKEIDIQKDGAGTNLGFRATTLKMSINELRSIKENEIDLENWSAFDWYWTEGSFGQKVTTYIHRETRSNPKSL